jgi:acyl-CoA thioester hydrolase
MKSDFTFFHRLRVRWSEVDMQKVVFNGNYFNYFDVAVYEPSLETSVSRLVAQYLRCQSQR